MPKIKQSIETTIVDENGVVKQSRSNQVKTWGEEPAYIKLYLKDLMYLSDMPKQYAELTMSLLKRVSYAGDADGLCVTLVSRTKKAICEELGWKNVSSLDNALQKLLKGKIIFRVDRGIFRMNPNLFGKGDWQDISRLRMEVGYDITGKTFATECEYEAKQKHDKQPEPMPGPGFGSFDYDGYVKSEVAPNAKQATA